MPYCSATCSQAGPVGRGRGRTSLLFRSQLGRELDVASLENARRGILNCLDRIRHARSRRLVVFVLSREPIVSCSAHVSLCCEKSIEEWDKLGNQERRTEDLRVKLVEPVVAGSLSSFYDLFGSTRRTRLASAV